ncbi:hypothetical protein VTI74DRAFT_4227 [Chaetomium olivicolor]
MNTATVSLAVTPTVVSTLLSHYLNRKPLAHKPTAHLSYDQGLHLIRSFLTHASHHTVEELQAFTGQWVPHPQWVKVDPIEIPEKDLSQAADLLVEQLGPDGIRQVGGREWWRWRKPNSPLKAEWIEMKADYQERKKTGDPGNRVMLYVHGGAYYFGSVDEHRYQIQRHARKLKARALAPRYRLAPQFPFPCGLQDCLATYLYLISQQKPSTVILAGDSAGGGMVLSMLVILRDTGIPLPAGAVLVSPWVDLTHSFPSVAGDCPLDYIPPSGFHHKPSPAWPPPDEEELEELKKVALAQKKKICGEQGEPPKESGIPTVEDVRQSTHKLKFVIDGKEIVVKEQIQMYTTNALLAHPLVSPIMQPTLGGMPPLFIMVGGGELLRDEQIYLAHKCANPSEYLPPEALMDDKARALVGKYKPTDVQLQVWDDMCHVGPTLSFTRPAKFMYRSIAQFSAWALSHAQKTEVDIPHDEEVSVISSSSSSLGNGQPAGANPATPPPPEKQPSTPRQNTLPKPSTPTTQPHGSPKTTSIGKAGDPLPPFTNHMIRQRVTRHGAILPLPPPSELPGCCMPRDLVGVVKVGTVRKWHAHKTRWDAKFKQTKARVHQQRLRDVAVGYEVFGEGEVPPPTALAGRRRIDGKAEEKEGKRSRVKGLGLAIWGAWGSKHDEMTLAREREKAGKVGVRGVGETEGEGAREFEDLKRQEREVREGQGGEATGEGNGAWTEIVERGEVGEKSGSAPVPDVLDLRPAGPVASPAPTKDDEADKKPAHVLPHEDGETNITGKRVFFGGLATPFSLRKEPETASMITLVPTPMDQRSVGLSTADSSSFVAGPSGQQETADDGEEDKDKTSVQDAPTPGFVTPFMTPFLTPLSPVGRPEFERFVTAEEGIPKASR